MKSLIETVYNDIEVKKYVNHFAGKLYRQFSSVMEFEDAKQELWLAVCKAITERWSPDHSLSLKVFAMRSALSHYGHLTDSRRDSGMKFNSRVCPNTIEDYCDIVPDTHHHFIDSILVKDSLDRIESSLKKLSKTAKHYRLALGIFTQLRKDDASLSKVINSLGVPESTGRRAFQVCKTVAEKLDFCDSVS